MAGNGPWVSLELFHPEISGVFGPGGTWFFGPLVAPPPIAGFPLNDAQWSVIADQPGWRSGPSLTEIVFCFGKL